MSLVRRATAFGRGWYAFYDFPRSEAHYYPNDSPFDIAIVDGKLVATGKSGFELAVMRVDL